MSESSVLCHCIYSMANNKLITTVDIDRNSAQGSVSDSHPCLTTAVVRGCDHFHMRFFCTARCWMKINRTEHSAMRFSGESMFSIHPRSPKSERISVGSTLSLSLAIKNPACRQKKRHVIGLGPFASDWLSKQSRIVNITSDGQSESKVPT